MTIIKRACANCCAFNPAPDGDDPTCENLTFFTEYYGTPQVVNHEPGPDDWCPSHKTFAEDKAEDAAIVLFWQRLGIEHRVCRRTG